MSGGLNPQDHALLEAFLRDMAACPQHSDSKPRKRLRRSHLPADLPTTLDLHGCTLEEAHRRLVTFLDAHDRAGTRDLHIITGKGKGGPGSLRYEVPRWLSLSDMKQRISMLSSAHPRQGGAGALRVRLRPRPESK